MRKPDSSIQPRRVFRMSGTQRGGWAATLDIIGVYIITNIPFRSIRVTLYHDHTQSLGHDHLGNYLDPPLTIY